jgi:soluble lytic murein transglycosylase
MLRHLRTLFLVLAGAAIVALGLRLLLSRDPRYTAQAMLHGGDFWAYDELITAAAKKHGLDPMLVKAVVWRESKFQPEMVGTSGERGLMQVGEAAAADWAKAEKVETFMPTDLFDPKTNLDVGVWYLDRAFERWKGRDDPIPFALAEYNAGRSRVDRWIAESELGANARASDFIARIDIASTRRYIEDITARYRYYRERGRL